MNESPIDTYLSATRSLVLIAAATVGALAPQNLVLARGEAGRLLILGLTAETERYFRELLGGIVSFCPVTQDSLKDDSISLSDALRREGRGVGRGLFDSVSFTSEKNIRDATSRVIGSKIPTKGALAKCLTDFQKLSHVRHAAVHSGGQMADHNAIAVGLDPSRQQCVRIEFSGFERAVHICHNLVRAYNRYMNERVVDRWIRSRMLHGAWQQDKSLYRKLFALFRSAVDGSEAKSAYHAYQSLRGAILASQQP